MPIRLKHRNRFCCFLAVLMVTCAGIHDGDARADDQESDVAQIATLIFGVKARRNVDPSLALVINEVIQGVYQNEKSRRVIGRSEIEQIIEFETNKQLIGCEDESCLVELAAAMNVERIVSGTVDKVGSAYFVVLNELNVNEIQNEARVQQRLPLDEDQFFEGIERMSRALLAKSKGSASPGSNQSVAVNQSVDDKKTNTVASPQAPPPVVPKENPGIVSITSDIPIEVALNEKSMGKTPLQLESTAAGTLTFFLKPIDGPPLEVSAPVELGATTLVEMQSKVTPKATAEEIEEYDSEVFWSRLKTCGILGCGLAQCSSIIGVTYASILIGAVLAAESGAIWLLYSCGITGFCVPSMCTAATLGYGCYRVFCGGPSHPEEEKQPVNRVIVTPPGQDADILQYDYNLKASGVFKHGPAIPRVSRIGRLPGKVSHHRPMRF